MPDENENDKINNLEHDEPHLQESAFTPSQPQQEHVEPTPLQAPSFAPQPVTVAPTVEQVLPKTNPGLLVLQWLVYAFWGWTALSLTWLTTISVGHYVNSDDSDSYLDFSSIIAYALAAVIVLFIISLVCDVFYARQESRQKHGATMIIMVIHAVIFALFGIGSLIVAVFAGISLLIGTSEGSNDGATTTLISALIICTVYGATLLRTLNLGWFKHGVKVYWVFMTIVAVTIATLGIMGPIAKAHLAKDDVALEQGLPSISNAIADYVEDNNKLPSSLDQLSSLDDSAEKIVKEKKVEYTPKEQLNTTIGFGSDETTQGVRTTRQQSPVFHYSLCVEYKGEKGSDYGGGSRRLEGNDYDTSPDTYEHDAGRVCYELQTDYTF